MDDCPFCTLTEAVLESALAYAHYDKFPVNPKHLLIPLQRHVAIYFDNRGGRKRTDLIPRHRADVADPRGGVRGVIPTRQHY